MEIIEKYGNWFQALCDETLIPFTMMQERFIRVFKGEYKPVSIEEKAWIKYLSKKRNEEKPGEPKDNVYLPHENPFYTDAMYNQQHKIMFGVIRENHKN